MKCPDCDGSGDGGVDHHSCFLCDGSGTLCDRCGEAADAGAALCDECEEEPDVEVDDHA